jgi:hypothetical protein
VRPPDPPPIVTVPAWDDTSVVSWLDLALVVLFVASLVGGYRRGAVLQVIGLSGLAIGLVLGGLVAPHLAALGHSPTAHVILAMAAVLIGGGVGNLLGWLAGSRLREHTQGSRLRRADAFFGSLVSVAALLLATWFLALNLANGPFPGLARGIRSSRIVQGLDAVMPQPPSLIGEAQRVLAQLGFPDVFIGLPPIPAAPVPPPPGVDARQAYRAAAASTFEILGSGCYVGYYNQGSGFVVRTGYVITNAHVVAGTTKVWLHSGAGDYAAEVVAIDPRADLALLHAPDLTAPALRFTSAPAARGDGGAVLGYPGGGPLTADAAAVRATIAPVGRDIYGQGEVTRRLYEIQAAIRHGNSGGPFVLADGQVAGVVFASSVLDDNVGYAIAGSSVMPFLRGAVGGQVAVPTGHCTG